MEKATERGLDWAGLPVIATVARLLCRELTLQNEYLRLANRILEEKVSGQIRFTEEERRPLMRMPSALETALRALGAWMSLWTGRACTSRQVDFMSGLQGNGRLVHRNLP